MLKKNIQIAEIHFKIEISTGHWYNDIPYGLSILQIQCGIWVKVKELSSVNPSNGFNWSSWMNTY